MPVTVTVVPPAVPPRPGLTDVTDAVRAASYVNAAADDTDAPPDNVTMTSHADAGAAGAQS